MRDVSIDEIVSYPYPGMRSPIHFSFAPDGEHLTYLDDPAGGLRRTLMARKIPDGEPRSIFSPTHRDEADLPLEEKLRRERLRERGQGVTRFFWSRTGQKLLIPLAGEVWIQDGIDGDARMLLSRAQGPTFSPDGRLVGFVSGGEVYVIDVDADDESAARKLTDGEPGTTRGLAEYIAQEEMGRMRGFWFSPDSRQIAFVDVDERHIPEYRILHQGADRRIQESHAYPFAGEKNATVRLGVVDVQTGQTRWVKLSIGDETEDLYLARVHWDRDNQLLAEIQDRRQTTLELARFDLETGEKTVLVTETSDVWINLHTLFFAMKDGFLWGSEQTGFMHLRHYAADGTLKAAVTAGDWMVESIAAVDVDRGEVYFTATRDSPLQKHLYVVSLDGSAPRRLTPAGGYHHCTVSLQRRQFLDRSSDVSTPNRITLRDLDSGEAIQVLHENRDSRVEGLTPPEMVTVTTRDGETLYGALYAPEGDGPWPLLVSVYGGPHAQRVYDNWALTVDLRAQHLRTQGFAVFKLDNRGSARRGLAFEGTLRWNMGDIEVRDQVDGVAAMVARGVADPKRVGVYGWSYGGYMSLMCLAKAPETFAAAASGAPVTHWDTYDTHYTERYMGRPQENPEGYERSAVMAHVDGITGDLLLIHGLIDENVLFRHTARLINALNRQQIPYDLLLFPDERHMPRGARDRVYMETRIRDFFKASLGQ
ncbi:MAG: DPP IV N-terminal domain-containing protein [Myxococcota bacterium]